MGGRDSSEVQGSLAEESHCILGKRFSIALGVAPQQVWMTRRLATLIARLLVRTPSPWETMRYLILVIGGAINYVPLIGIPRPLQLRRFDLRIGSYLRGYFRAAASSERVGFYASSSDGGFGLASILGLYIQATARELMVLLLGDSEASLLARGTVRRLMFNGGGASWGFFGVAERFFGVFYCGCGGSSRFPGMVP